MTALSCASVVCLSKTIVQERGVARVGAAEGEEGLVRLLGVHRHRDVPRAVGAESSGVLVHVLVVRGLVEVPDAVETLGLAVQQLGLGHAPVVLRTREVQRGARTRLPGRHRDALRLLEDRAAEPEHRGLAVRVAVHAAAREVVGAVVLRARPLADVRDVAELVHARNEREEGTAEGASVRLLVEPAVFHALREGVGEHRRAGTLGPGIRFAHELRPHAVLALLLEERLHHLAVAFQDARTVLAVLREVLERHRHRGGHPAVAASPHERHVGRVVEKAVQKLQLVEVEDELLRGAVDVLPVARKTIRLRLEGGDHVGVVDPEARLVRVALLPPGKARLVGRLVVPRRRIVGLRLLPLLVGERETEIARAFLAGEDGDLERHGTHDGEVDVLELRQDVPLRTVVGRERVDQLPPTG